MTAGPRQLEYRRLQAPREDGAALVVPPFDEVGSLVQGNVRLREKYDYDLSGRSLRELAAEARAELLREARHWTSAYRNVDWLADRDAELIFLAGHQPQLFHPGVWFKNFALGALARRQRAVAVNLIIDSDTAKSVALRVPGGTPDRPQVEMIPFDRPQEQVPYEERRVADQARFAAFGQRVAERIRPLVPDPLIGTFWPMVLQRLTTTDNLGACVAQARHRLEGQWGLETLEIPQSRICASGSFAFFSAHLLAELPRFRDIYNEAVREYRRVHRIRNASQPMPDLAAEGSWLEAPLWVWTAAAPTRRRLFACRRGTEIVLSDRGTWEAVLPFAAEGDASAAAERLRELAREGVRIRSRAVITTLWARLVLGDLFLHGIGGAKYDQVTNLLIERFFGLAPPEFMVLSATSHLPIQSPKATAEELIAIRQQLRDLTYHPERHLDSAKVTSLQAADNPAELIAEKRRWIDAAATAHNARTRCRAIRHINEQLQPWMTANRETLLALQEQTAHALHARTILQSREYAFCLYPEKTLREFLEGLLPKGA